MDSKRDSKGIKIHEKYFFSCEVTLYKCVLSCYPLYPCNPPRVSASSVSHPTSYVLCKDLADNEATDQNVSAIMNKMGLCSRVFLIIPQRHTAHIINGACGVRGSAVVATYLNCGLDSPLSVTGLPKDFYILNIDLFITL